MVGDAIRVTLERYNHPCFQLPSQDDETLLALHSATLEASTLGLRSSHQDKVPTVEQWDAAGQKASDAVQRLTLSEKIGVVTGQTGGPAACVGSIAPIAKIGFGGLCLQDGPSAVNRHQLVSIFPAGVTTAATFDKRLMFERGVALGEEFRDKGIHVLLGPSGGPLGRHPLGGRNWESFSADPYLTGEAMRLSIIGSQSVGVQTCAKHLVGQEQDTQRNSMSSNIDDRTLHEVYLWPFYDSVKAGTTSIMAGHNKLNGTFSSESKELLLDILRDELGFRGYVMSDWWGTHSVVGTANGGLDLEQPGYGFPEAGFEYYWGDKLEAAVRDGEVTEQRIDDMVQNILTPYYLMGQDGDSFPNLDNATTIDAIRDVRGDHARLIRKIGSAGTVLLKNDNEFLPLSTPKNGKRVSIGVFGNDAGDYTNGLWFSGWEPYPGPVYGSLTTGGGAGAGYHSNLVTPLEAIRKRARDSGALLQYILNNDLLAANNFGTIYPTPDICLVFIKTFMAEAWDRTEWENDWNSTAVVNNVASQCPGRTVVITHSGGVNTMPWAENPNVTAILAAGYPGEEIGNAIASVLWGDDEPSGRLPHTIPKSEEDYVVPVVTQPAGNAQSNFSEGLLIDYRHYDANNIEPLYEFGFGLGYTTFKFTGGMEIKKFRAATNKFGATPNPGARIIPGGNEDLWTELLEVKVSVKNTGSRKGWTTPQLYLSYPEDVPEGTPVKVLRGFEKYEVRVGDTKNVYFKLTRRDLSYWDVVGQTWRVPKGDFDILVGFSSRNLPLKSTVKLL
ncbi:glycosyl hydrolase family 3 N terminal domain-containing [Paramyrothecium foliicola]|nr:glycosyl hydrolase family 3 N terminal domain-containing [Paramyrothecium foliicola]